MKKFVLWSWLLTKRQLKSIYFLIVLMLIPLAAFIIGKLPEDTDEGMAKIALYSVEDSDVAANTTALLLENDCYEFYICDSKEAVINDVATGMAECGYIFNEDIESRIKAGKYKGLISTVSKSNSIVAGMANETVFSQFFKEATSIIMINYVENEEVFDAMHIEGIEQLKGAYDSYTLGEETFNIEFEMIGKDGDLEDTKIIEASNDFFPLRNFLAILVFVGGMLGVVNWMEDMEKGVFNAMSCKTIVTGRFTYGFVPCMLIGISMLVTLIVTGNSEGLIKEVLYMAVYIGMITVLGVLITYVIKASNIFGAMVPLIAIAAVFVCPVFVDLSMSIPAIKIIRQFFLPYYYMTMF